MITLQAGELDALSLSLLVACCSVALALPPALLMGWLLARKNWPGKTLVNGILHLPLVMPPVTVGYLLLLILGRRGMIGAWLEATFGLRLAFTWHAAVIASAIVSFPLILRSIRVALELVDPGLEQAARTLGASRLRTARRITLPLAWPGILSGIVVGFARSLGEFGATITFAGNIAGETRTLPLAIYAYMQMPGREDAALTLVGWSIAISLAALGVSEILIRRARQRGQLHA